jgi:hypothetical protein
MYCDKCESNPCTCQDRLHVPKPADQWHVRPCPNGDAMIRERVGVHGPILCKWCQARAVAGLPQPTRLEPKPASPAVQAKILEFTRD